MRPALGVTVSAERDEALMARARARAEEWGLPFIDRRRKGSVKALIGVQADALLTFGGDGVTLWDGLGPLRFSPQMARLRIKSLDAGRDEDLMVRLGELKPGDHVLDCTLGLGADALVAARVVGEQGRVVGLEKSLPLYALVSEGLASFQPRIEAVHADAAIYLKTAPRFDVVLFDPMFAKPRGASPAFEALRRHADHSELTIEMIAWAARVARRWVLVKGARYTRDLKKLGLIPHGRSKYATVDWARIGGKGPHHG